MVIRMRHTPSHTKNRRSHHALASAHMVECSRCKAVALPHRVCARCGFYRGREVVDVLKNLSKKERKAKEKEIQKPS
ncbi:50S ribosomal protein L32 [Candidatus Giovannonibacteria bacterium RIFCSPHIGHO2_02_FULL_46_20]|uniref:Large ribosomal subunit protein bL32 n=1 Tax=Candidatus Giovannonibacteria bacterium RIFCSPHIGHO2_02_FULL_46_20 TaxID=1798338 RepID=A0A1F5WE50_9BACT|nr:MAG: 50S ribosomal protein L32 [Candidatus Giovannonibacteria bacterium RIFCSPHIGHO2_02_FULL_46_20]